jgi:DNA-binding MarR family transcriptional regulator
LKAEGVNLMQGLLLTALLFEDSETTTPSQIAAIFQTSRANVSHMVSHLEARGWVKRTVNKNDARQFHLTLKPEGRKLALRLVKFYDQVQNRIEETMGAVRSRRLVEGLFELSSIYRKE